MSSSEPQLVTQRLLLRLPRREDFAPFAAMMADEETTRFLGGTQSRALAWRSFLCLAGAWRVQGFSMFSVIEQSSGCWIGRVGPWQPEGWPGSEVGWGIAREYWGRGYASEAATAAIDWAFDQLGWSEVIHCIAPENARSQAVARRLGSRVQRSARMPPPLESVTAEIWGQSREQWQARSSAAASPQ